MGLLDGISQKSYYQGDDLGNYQFVSLDDIITQFEIMYVGEDKVIPKIKRADIAFHAQRAMAELSFDTFKSFKSQQIELPPSLVMPLPHDYVNYTKMSWVDASGIKRPMYPTKHTSNPFQVNQDSNKAYEFLSGQYQLTINGDFSAGLEHGWESSGSYELPINVVSAVSIEDGVLTFSHQQHLHPTGLFLSANLAVWQPIDVTGIDTISMSADGVGAVAVTGEHSSGVLRFGLSEAPGDESASNTSYNSDLEIFIENGYVEWVGTTSTQELVDIDVSAYDQLYVVITSSAQPETSSTQTITAVSTIDNISVVNPASTSDLLAEGGFEINSSTWNSYKSNTPSENNSDDYEDNTYWSNNGERYGLEPSHAQVNGSFYIDDRLGRIHFSSNISGKTVILDYISDGLGTDGEMKVHKLAEDAMYKHIICDVMGTRANVGRNQLAYYKKDKFAAVRKAKLRLSNIKLEELTQILRGQSKHIKH